MRLPPWNECDIRNLPSGLGRFDYVIAHGLYSSIPTAVRTRDAGDCAPSRAEGRGIRGYNALPGSHLRDVVWDMVKYHTRAIADKRAKVAAARELLEPRCSPDRERQRAPAGDAR